MQRVALRRAGLRSFRLPIPLVLLLATGCGDPAPLESRLLGPQLSSAPFESRVESRAFFFVQREQLDSDDWPELWRGYDTFVCDPPLGSQGRQRIRADFPRARILAYANAQSIRIHMHNDPYWLALTAAFDSSLCIRNLETGSVVRLDRGVPSFVMRRESADVLVAFHRDVTMAAGWDGMYFDQVNLHYPDWKRQRLLEMAPLFDIDDDGTADDLAHLDATYETWKPYFLAEFRAAVGDGTLMLGNSNGPLGDPSLNGLTLENIGLRFTAEDARAWILEQDAVSRTPRMHVLWAISPISWIPSERLASQMRGVLVGDTQPRPPIPEADRRNW